MNSKSVTWLIVIIIVLVVAGGAVWYFTSDSTTISNTNNTNTTTQNQANGNLSVPGEIPVRSTEPILVFIIDPPTGPVSGEQQVTLTGSGFIEGVKVYFNDTEAQSVTFVNSEQLKVATPKGDAGVAAITVTNPDGLSSNIDNGYTYE